MIPPTVPAPPALGGAHAGGPFSPSCLPEQLSIPRLRLPRRLRTTCRCSTSRLRPRRRPPSTTKRRTPPWCSTTTPTPTETRSGRPRTTSRKVRRVQPPRCSFSLAARPLNPLNIALSPSVFCSQWWPSTTTPGTRTTSWASSRGPSSTWSRRTTTAGSRGSATASRGSSPATTWSPSCTTPTEGTSRWQYSLIYSVVPLKHRETGSPPDM